jgi:hypothetical protein
MKRKIFFILIIFCSLNIFSTAGKDGGKCCKYSLCPANNESMKQNSSIKPDRVLFDLSPIQVLMFSI